MAFEVTASPFPASGANILTGSLIDTTGTLISVPAGRTWVGQISCGVTVTHTAAATGKVTVSTPNTAGVFPQNAILAHTIATCGANSEGNNNTVVDVTVVNTTGSAINLTVGETAPAGTVTSYAIAFGVLA